MKFNENMTKIPIIPLYIFQIFYNTSLSLFNYRKKKKVREHSRFCLQKSSKHHCDSPMVFLAKSLKTISF
jgi:hypothetical protein